MPNKAKSKDRILLAAVREFADHGYAGARVDRVARAAEANKQLIYYYFGSKRGLHYGALQHIRDRWSIPTESEATSDTGPLGVRRELAALIGKISDSLQEIQLLLRALLDEETAAEPRAMLSEVLGRISDAISKGQGVGHFRDEADPGAHAWAAVSMALGDALLRVATPQVAGSPQGRERLLTEMVLRGLAW